MKNRYLVPFLLSCSFMLPAVAQEATLVPKGFTNTNWNWHASDAPRRPIAAPPAWGWGRKDHESARPIVTPVDDGMGTKFPWKNEPVPVDPSLTPEPIEPKILPDVDVSPVEVTQQTHQSVRFRSAHTPWTWETGDQ